MTTSLLERVQHDDADELEHHYGVAAAIQMLHEGELTAAQFLALCAEAAGEDVPDGVAQPA